MKIVENHDVKSANYGDIIVQNILAKDKNTISVDKITITANQKLTECFCDSYYYILDGSGKLHIQHKTAPVNKGDFLFIPQDTKFIFEGELTALLIKKN